MMGIGGVSHISTFSGVLSSIPKYDTPYTQHGVKIKSDGLIQEKNGLNTYSPKILKI